MDKWEVYQVAHETHWGFCIQDTATKKYKEVSECYKTESDAYKALANYLQDENARLKNKAIIWNESVQLVTKKYIDLKTQLSLADKVIGLYKELDDERDWYKTYTKNICGCTRKAYEVAGRIVPAGRCAAHGDIAKALADYDNSRGKGARREPESRVELINRIQGNVRVEIEESDATLTDAMETHSDLMNLGDALFNQPSEMKTSDEITDRIGGLKKGRESEQDEDTIGAYNTIINALNWVLGKGPKHGGNYVATPPPSDKCKTCDGRKKIPTTHPQVLQACHDCKGTGKADG